MTINEGLASLGMRAKLAQWLLAGSVGLLVLGLLARFVFSTIAVTPTGMITAFALASLGIVSLLRLLVIVATIIVVPLWVYRAWTNLRLIGVAGLHHSPAWAALSFFVPIANLFVPFQAMRELYNRSTGEEEHFAHSSVGDVTSWWACFIGGSFVSAFTVAVPMFNILTGGVLMITAPPFIQLLMSLFGTVLMIAAAYFLWRVIAAITSAQRSFAGIAETFA
ncbi:MAG TPA: DUF4328 domain-containing protein [Sphingomonadaceae bacterium]|nr:DUF4328 domain-containing protein [Sphingomonadaceae bacterium]